MLHIPKELQPAIEGDNCSYLGQLFWSDISSSVSSFILFFPPVHLSPIREIKNIKLLFFVLQL